MLEPRSPKIARTPPTRKSRLPRHRPRNVSSFAGVGALESLLLSYHYISVIDTASIVHLIHCTSRARDREGHKYKASRRRRERWAGALATRVEYDLRIGRDNTKASTSTSTSTSQNGSTHTPKSTNVNTKITVTLSSRSSVRTFVLSPHPRAHSERAHVPGTKGGTHGLPLACSRSGIGMGSGIVHRNWCVESNPEARPVAPSHRNVPYCAERENEDGTGQGEAKMQEERLTQGARPNLDSCLQNLIGSSRVATPTHADSQSQRQQTNTKDPSARETRETREQSRSVLSKMYEWTGKHARPPLRGRDVQQSAVWQTRRTYSPWPSSPHARPGRTSHPNDRTHAHSLAPIVHRWSTIFEAIKRLSCLLRA